MLRVATLGWPTAENCPATHPYIFHKFDLQPTYDKPLPSARRVKMKNSHPVTSSESTGYIPARLLFLPVPVFSART